jgi:membrane-associated PAP2 superfamily phosphatase
MVARDTLPAQALHDLLATCALLALLLCWEVSGADLLLAARYGSGHGFALRDAWWTRTLLHDGGRWLAGAALGAAALHAWHGGGSGLARPHRLAWLALVLLGLVVVPALKQASASSCPWDLALFGGPVPYVPHWMLMRADGGPGHCFPSGHAVAAFAFLPLYFQWRAQRPRLAWALLAAMLALGLLFGWAQLARGAHFPSHTMWSAWLCWTIGAAGARALEPAGAPPQRETRLARRAALGAPTGLPADASS